MLFVGDYVHIKKLEIIFSKSSMNEPKFKQYLNREITAEEFLQSWPEQPNGINYNISSDVIELESDFEINSAHLIRLCDDAISGNLSVYNLSAIAYWLIFSTWFNWNVETLQGKIIDKTIFSWNESNLTIESIKLWKEYLISGSNVYKS